MKESKLNNPYLLATEEYNQVRPNYPDELITLIAAQAEYLPGEILEVGAGTGRLTKDLLTFSKVTALEPSAPMRSKLATLAGEQLTIVPTTLEDSNFPQASFSQIIFSQSWHWCNPQITVEKIRSYLQPSGTILVVFNQLDVSIPWVKRLTRIMRSGDVHKLSKPPALGEEFSPVLGHAIPFTQELTFEQVMTLGRTRSSYLKSTSANQQKMQQNLKWYLEDHLGIPTSSTIKLPYHCLVFAGQR
ncbi:hypothetical protein BK816_03615 [Boudabousia tangfeifanii]|uniref:Methyltransferase type 11 domain-containing protein n=1 Tax=Boudabousia tangfeifanii TaxID=1912795 RepID=A0A1D9MJM3_9ACTO|nr:methyltransferase domain-containing protein [Boudabousia tangfeifanii]AOZ72494.1 hypothetical protein BK816_03615 [Boudabousia tangfeifanii]